MRHVGHALPILVLAIIGCEDRTSSPPRDDSAAPWFVECAADAGIDFVHHSGHTPGQFLFPETVCGGAALFDMDGDYDLDAYLVQAGRLDGAASPRATNRLYRNRGDGTFDDVTIGSGADLTGYGMGVACGDYDSDGDVDLYVTALGRNTLLANDGAGRFTDVTEHADVGEDSWSASAAFVDLDRDGHLDLFVTNYVNWSLKGEIDCVNPAGAPDYCSPTRYAAPQRDTVYHNNGDGTFTDVSIKAGLGSAFGNGLGVVCADFTGDGLVDIFVANDATPNQLWVNRSSSGAIRLEDEANVRGCAIDEAGRAKAGMGVDATDLDRDGDFDLLVVNLQGETDSYYRNDGPYFTDATARVGLAGLSRGFTRFGVGLIDFNNDGLLDLYQVNGRVRLGESSLTSDPFAEPNVLLRSAVSGKFQEVQPRGGTSELLVHTSRAAAFGDIDNDGGIDILVVNRDGPAYLLRNVAPDRGHWIMLRVIDAHGRDAIGAVVTATIGERDVMRQANPAYSYCASNDPRVHIGLGAHNEPLNVTIRWPDGASSTHGPLEVDMIHTIEQP